MQNYLNTPQNFHSLNCNGRPLNLSEPKIMGILNLTPDSFSDGGKFPDAASALSHAEKMMLEGATIIDIGPQSTRPGAEFLTAETEIQRLGKIIYEIKKEFPDIFVSVDTFHAETVAFAFNEGMDIINDISGGQFDQKMFETAAATGLPYILTHGNEIYEAMHQKKKFNEITVEINKFFSEKALHLDQSGVQDIILDPGFGFGKTVEDQHKLLDELEFVGFGRFPLLVGISRKSFIYKPLGKNPGDINEETQKLHLKALRKGAKILRVHDVSEAKKTVECFKNDI